MGALWLCCNMLVQRASVDSPFIPRTQHAALLLLCLVVWRAATLKLLSGLGRVGMEMWLV